MTMPVDRWTTAAALLCAGLIVAGASCQAGAPPWGQGTGGERTSFDGPTTGGWGSGCPGGVGGGGCGSWGNDASTGNWMGGGGGPSIPPTPDTTPVTLAATPPPALGGGTLIVMKGGAPTVASDPDRDTVSWADLTVSQPAVHTVALQPGDEPGRLVEDAAGLVHVVLRRGGAVVTLDLGAAKVVRRTPVCPAPRGIAYDAGADAVIVACVGGELVSLAAADDTVLHAFQVEPDLRDVDALGAGWLVVSKLRSAEVLLLDATGAVRSRTRPLQDDMMATDPRVAWRMTPIPGVTGVAVAHQLATTATIQLAAPGAWSGGGGPSADVVTSHVSFFTFDLTKPDTPPTVTSIALEGALPVDLAVDPSAAHVLVTLYGSGVVREYQVTGGSLSSDWSIGATSAAYDGLGRRVAFSREPASFATSLGVEAPVPGAASVLDTGFDLFHRAARMGGSLACASCHPEGRDDGRVWVFDPLGPRRTKSLVGGVMETAPFHWAGDLVDLDTLMAEVFTNRMGGFSEDPQHVAALARFLDAIPRVPIAAPPPSASFDNGKALFESAAVGCTGCHSGAHLTTNAIVDVGTGRPFKVPTLIGVGLRAPYLHDGCATTLLDRFGPCGGGDQHGQTSQLSQSDLSDLVLYVGSL